MLCVTRPRKNVFVPSPYNETELKELFDCISGHPLELLIKLTATYGLRRSEVLGLRWKAFNFEKNTLSIFHTVYEEKGKKRWDNSNRQRHCKKQVQFSYSPSE